MRPKIEDLSAFAAVVETGSLSAAARRLELAKSVISKRLADLERVTGAELIRRTTRKVSTTEAGQAFYLRARQILGDLDAAIEDVGGEKGPLRGSLRIAAPVTFGQNFLAQVLIEYACAHREVELVIDCDDRMVDLAGEGYDVGVRIGRLPDSSLVARKLTPSPRVLVASPAYIERAGTPKRIEDLPNHTCIGYSNVPTAHLWQFAPKREGDVPRSVSMRARFSVNNGDIGVQAAIAGLGVSVTPLFMVADAINKGKLVQLLKNDPPTADTVYAVWPPQRQTARKLRVLIELLAKRLPERMPKLK